jgi:hypothetical protein
MYVGGVRCKVTIGSGQPGDFDVPVIVVLAAPGRAAWRRPIGIGIGAIVVHGAAPTDHDITAYCPPAHDEYSDITAHCPPAHDRRSMTRIVMPWRVRRWVR